MDQVFAVWLDIDTEDIDDVRLIGVYSDKKKAEHALSRARARPELRKFDEFLKIVCYDIGRDGWTEGFFTWTGDEA